MITVDTSGLLAALKRDDPHHVAAVSTLHSHTGPIVVPSATLCEIAYFLERSYGARAVDPLLSDIESGRFRLDCGEVDLRRIRELIGRYADLRLGFVDAAVIACAERLGGVVLTFDLRHFGVVSREGTIRIVP